MSNVNLYSGSPAMIDHTPGSALTAGDVVESGGITGVALRDIAANEKDAIAVDGGVFTCPTATGASTAIAAGVEIFWDVSAGVVDDDSDTGTNKHFGVSIEANGDSDATIKVLKTIA